MYTRKDLRRMYNVSAYKIRQLLAEAHINSKYRLITPREFEQLKAMIGEPPRP